MREVPREQLRPVHVLVSEDFFLEKVVGAVRALERHPLVPDWAGSVPAQVAGHPAAEMVVDLEVEEVDVLGLLRGLRADARTRDMRVLGYCSHNLKDLITSAQALGVRVYVRSTFAANLVRLLQDLFRPPETAPETGNE